MTAASCARWGASLAVMIASACHPCPTSAPRVAVAAASLQLDKAELIREGASEDFVRELEGSRFRYFRMLAEPFELRTCDAFRDQAAQLPITVVQGDAHIEQFVVTTNTYGLEDFDHAGFGPAVVDLVRYAASLHVVCSDAAWRCDADAAIEQFLTTYRGSLLAEPTLREPAIVQRLRAKAPSSRASWLAWVDTLMLPTTPELEADIRRSWVPFARLMHDIHPEWTESAMAIVRLGLLRIGFGSALERKLLVRIEGPTSQPDDDVVVEAREGLAPETKGCVWRGSYGESLVLMFTSILGRRMPELHGFAALLGSSRHFWLQSWDPGYVELSIRDVGSQSDLEELAIDAAHQLAGHLWTGFPERLRRYQRYAQMKAFDETRPRVIQLARELAAESNAGWERFRTRR